MAEGKIISRNSWAILHAADFSNTQNNENYLHYIYNHSGLKGTEINPEALRRRILNSQKINFADRMKSLAIETGDVDRIMRLFGQVTGKNPLAKKLEESIAEQFNNTSNNTGARSTGLKDGKGNDISFAAFGAYASDPASLSKAASNLADEVGTIQGAAQDAVDECFLAMAEIYPDLLNLAIKYATDAENRASAEASKTGGDMEQILLSHILKQKNATLIKIPTNSELNKAQQDIVSTLARLTLLVNAIPVAASRSDWDYKSFNTKNHNVESQDQLIATLLGKIGGNLSHFSGGLAEIGVLVGITKAQEKIAKSAIKILDSAVTGSNVIVSVSKDKELEKKAQEIDLSGTFQKNDVTVLIGNDFVTGYLGLSIKTSKNIKFDSQKNIITGKAKLQSKSPLLPMLESLSNRNISFGTILQIAGGQQEKNQSGLQAQWRSIVDLAVYNNFLNFISGSGNNVFDNSFAMVINGKIFSIYKILGTIAKGNNFQAIEYEQGKQRFPFANLNIWKRTNNNGSLEDEALSRSKEAITAIREQMQATKITINLNFQLLNW